MFEAWIISSLFWTSLGLGAYTSLWVIIGMIKGARVGWSGFWQPRILGRCALQITGVLLDESVGRLVRHRRRTRSLAGEAVAALPSATLPEVPKSVA